MIAQFSEIVWDEWANARGNFLSNIDVVQQALEGSIALQASPSMDAMRASYAALIDGAADGLDFLFRELARSYKLTTVGGTATLSALYHYQAQQGTPVTLESRAPTRAGSATAGGSNIGNGVFYITNVDQYGYVIEDMVGAVTDLRCTSDQATGTASGSEVFTAKLTGTVPTDSLSLPSGGEITETFTSLLNGGGILSNPSFDANKATGSVTGDGSKFTGWLSSGANANVTYTDTATEYYVISPGRRLVTSGAAHGRAAKFTGADSVYQQ